MKNTFALLSFVLLLSLFTVNCKKTNNGAAPVTSFSVTASGLKIICNNTSTNATSYSWDFGDNTALSIGISPLHNYEKAGTYTVTLTASGNGGSNKVSQTVTVSNTVINPSIVQFFLTNGNKSQLLQEQGLNLNFKTGTNTNPTITVDSTQSFQGIDGFGYCLTGGSAIVINGMEASQKTALLNELFGNSENSIGISYLRLSIGASDLNPYPFSYDDMPGGQTDLSLANFSLNDDEAGGTGLIPLLNEILAINPNIKLLATPWSPPVWMKTNYSFSGGGLNTAYDSVYAQYFVKYIQQMKAAGITIDAITPQNEPLENSNDPSSYMSATDQRDFIKYNLGPAFKAAGITTKIIIYDHNCDEPDYPLTILADPIASSYVNGSAFHLYAGDISALSVVHDSYPDKAIYYTEMWTGSSDVFGDALWWNEQKIVIGSMTNWSRIALQWNLANDPSFGPHTPGGCSECMGALTISGSFITRNPAYYTIAHVSKFVGPGSVRIASSTPSNLPNVAFLTPDGKKVLLVLNTASDVQTFNIGFKGKIVTATLQSGSVATFVWQ